MTSNAEIAQAIVFHRERNFMLHYPPELSDAELEDYCESVQKENPIYTNIFIVYD